MLVNDAQKLSIYLQQLKTHNINVPGDVTAASDRLVSTLTQLQADLVIRQPQSFFTEYRAKV